MKKVMVFGTFDILHKGHLNLFEQAKKHGDYLIIVVARDCNVAALKGNAPRNKENYRLEKVQPYADKVILGDLKDKSLVVTNYKPDVICLGYDQPIPFDDLEQYGIPIKRLVAFQPEKYKSSKISLS